MIQHLPESVKLICEAGTGHNNIDEAALIEALENVLLTSHMGWKGLETRQRLVSILADNIKKYMEGNPINVVSSL